MNELFKPTEEELIRTIQTLELRLQDDSYQAEWPQIHTMLLNKIQELQQLKAQTTNL